MSGSSGNRSTYRRHRLDRHELRLWHRQKDDGVSPHVRAWLDTIGIDTPEWTKLRGNRRWLLRQSLHSLLARETNFPPLPFNSSMARQFSVPTMTVAEVR